MAAHGATMISKQKFKETIELEFMDAPMCDATRKQIEARARELLGITAEDNVIVVFMAMPNGEFAIDILAHNDNPFFDKLQKAGFCGELQ